MLESVTLRRELEQQARTDLGRRRALDERGRGRDGVEGGAVHLGLPGCREESCLECQGARGGASRRGRERARRRKDGRGAARRPSTERQHRVRNAASDERVTLLVLCSSSPARTEREAIEVSSLYRRRVSAPLSGRRSASRPSRGQSVLVARASSRSALHEQQSR